MKQDEIAAQILIAAMQSAHFKTNTNDPREGIKLVAEAYGVILRAIRDADSE